MRVRSKPAGQTGQHLLLHLHAPVQPVPAPKLTYFHLYPESLITPGSVMLVAAILLLLFVNLRTKRKTSPANPS
jgi:hypothetical protein